MYQAKAVGRNALRFFETALRSAANAAKERAQSDPGPTSAPD
jgi:hypothetical protein